MLHARRHCWTNSINNTNYPRKVSFELKQIFKFKKSLKNFKFEYLYNYQLTLTKKINFFL